MATNDCYSSLCFIELGKHNTNHALLLKSLNGCGLSTVAPELEEPITKVQILNALVALWDLGDMKAVQSTIGTQRGFRMTGDMFGHPGLSSLGLCLH